MRCRKCSVWEINGRDLFCSWCGRKVFEFGLRKTPVRLYLAERKAQPRSAQIIENQSPIPVSIECVNPPPWLKINPVRSEVPPGGQFRVSLDVDFQKLGGFNYKAEPVVFRPAAAAGAHEDFENLEVRVETWPRPQVGCKELTFFTSKPPLRARLRVETDYPLTVTGVRFNLPYLTPEGDFPIELGEGGEAEIPVQLNLPPQAEFKKELVTYHLDVEGLAAPLTGQFDLIIRRSAVLHCPELEAGKFSARLMPGAEEEVTLKIHNLGEEVLRVGDVRVEPQKPTPHVAVRPEPRSFTVEPGKHAPVRLKVSASPTAQSASLFFQIVFESNDPVAEHAAGYLNVTVSNEVYPGYIALDFGTTDSAVAVFEMDELKPENLSLEKGVKDPKIYSNIVFMNYLGDEAEPPYEWKIGRNARSLAPVMLDFFVKAIKTRIGKNHSQTLTFTKLGVERPVTAEQVVKFIMMDLLQRTRQALGQSPVRFILSVPTRFTLRQKEILKETFHQAARSLRLDIEVEMIDESLAAGLFYIVKRGPRDELVRGKRSYNMMLLDFGGGTTDVTVFSVRRPAGALTTDTRGVEVETIGAWGDAELGGEEITTRVARLLAEKLLGRRVEDGADALTVRRLEDRAEVAKLAFSHLLGLPGTNGQIDFGATTEEGRRELRKSLEALNPGTKQYEDDEKLKSFSQKYAADGRRLEVLLPSEDRSRHESVQISEDEVAVIYEHKLLKIKKDLTRLLEKIGRRSAGAGDAPLKLDVLLLAGQSSQFPTVSRLLSDLAENVDFVRDSDGGLVLKECVSRGALYYSRRRRLGLKITGDKRIWSRLGHIDFGLGRDEFIELIPWGQNYPLETDPFPIYEVFGNTLELGLVENLSLDDDDGGRKIVKYKDFVLRLEGSPRDEYLCKLEVDANGDVRAFCEIDGDWSRMEERQ